jgi:predicted DNA-binding protein (UPF0251 family)
VALFHSRKIPSSRRGISPVFSESHSSVQTRKLIRQIYFTPETFRGPAYLKGMSTKTLPVTAAGFQKVFAALAPKLMQSRRSRSGKIAKDLADWRQIAWEALRRKKLDDTLRRAIEALSVKYREVLFLQDVKNLNTAETAWVLGITVGAARSRLLRARVQVRDALALGLLAKPNEKTSDRGNSCAHGIPCDFGVPTLQNSFSIA